MGGRPPRRYAAYPHGAAAKAKHAAAPEKDGLAAFAAAASTLPADDVTRVGTPMEMDNFLRLAVTGVEQDEAPLGIVVFTSKDDISPTTRALGATLGRHAGVKVGQWSAPPLEAVADFGVKKLPAVVAFYSVELDPNTPMMERGMQAAPYGRPSGNLLVRSPVSAVAGLRGISTSPAAASPRPRLDGMPTS